MPLAWVAALSLQVLMWRAPQLASRGVRAGRPLATGECDNDSPGWEAVDQWLQGEREHASVATVATTLDEPPRPLSPADGSLSQTSAGHPHHHFFSASASDFASLGASSQLVANLRASGFDRPSCAQADGFDPIRRGASLLLAHPAGTGKTLAFLAPIVDLLFLWEQRDGPVGRGEVRALVLVSSPELAQQTLSLARSLARRKLKCSLATGSHNYGTQRERIGGGLDLLIGTLGRVAGHAAPRGGRTPAFAARVRALVVDDFDSLYSTGGRGVQSPDEFRLLLRCLVGPSTQLTLASSVVRPSVLDAIHADLTLIQNGDAPGRIQNGKAQERIQPGAVPGLQDDSAGAVRLFEVIGGGLHVTRPGVQQTLIHVGGMGLGQSSFAARLAAAAHRMREGEPPARTLVVASTASTCDRLWAEMGRGDTRVGGAAPVLLCAHERMDGAARGEAVARFLAADGLGTAGPPRVLVATARMLRGLNLGTRYGKGGGGAAADDKEEGERQQVGEQLAGQRWEHGEEQGRSPACPVDHIVLFDFPPDGAAYVHRLGLATRGEATPPRVTLIATDRQIDYARRTLAQDAAGQPVGIEA